MAEMRIIKQEKVPCFTKNVIWVHFRKKKLVAEIFDRGKWRDLVNDDVIPVDPNGLVGYQFMGVATPSTNPGTPDQKVFYIAYEPGNYSNFGTDNVINDSVGLFVWEGKWKKENTTIPNNLSYVKQRIAKIIHDTAFTDNLSPYGDAIDCPITTTEGFYSIEGYFVSNSSFTTKTFDVEETSYYLIHTQISGGDKVASIAFIDSDNNVIGAFRENIDAVIKPSGAAKIALCNSNPQYIEISKYTSTAAKNIKDESVTTVKLATGAVSTEKLTPNSVNPDKTTFITSKNLFDLNDPDIMIGYYLADTEPISNSSLNLTGYIPVTSGKQYSSSSDGISTKVRFITFFYPDRTIHSYLSAVDNDTSIVTIPSGVTEVRISVNTTFWNKFQFEEGSIVTEYNKYEQLVKKSYLPKITFDDITFKEEQPQNKNILSPSKTVKEPSYFISSDDGTVVYIAGVGYGYTDYISIDAKGLAITGGYVGGKFIGHAVYDKDKQFIRGVRANVVEYQDGDAYVRFSILNVNNLQVERGLKQTSYIAYEGREIISLDVLPSMTNTSQNEKIELNLPDKIYAVVGDTLQLFYRGVIKAFDPYRYNILITCSKGNQYLRYWQYTPTSSDIGTTTLVITIRDDNLNTLAESMCELVTKDVVKSPSSNINVAIFGDSLTSGGIWCDEAYRRLTKSGGVPDGKQLQNISFVGSKKNGDAGFFGVGGWTWESYTTIGRPAYRFIVSGVTSLSIGAVYSNNGNTFTVQEINTTEGSGNILCSVDSLTPAPEDSGVLTKVSGNGDATINFSSVSADSQNPLWDSTNNKMSFIPYANKVAGGQIDVVYTLLSWNGQTPGRENFDSVITQVKTFADTLHSEFPNAKLKIMGLQIPSVRGGMGASYGATGTSYADGYGMVITALNQNQAYQDFANSDEYKGFVEFVNVSSQFDTEYNMPHKEENVNTRNTTKEWLDTNGVHPDTSGYYQIADVVYRNFIANFCQ